jgi:uncharacterized repeat protein (TIGR02543 family)
VKKEITLIGNDAHGYQSQDSSKTINTTWYLVTLLVLFTIGCKKDDHRTGTQSAPAISNKAPDAKLAVLLAANYTVSLSSNPIAGGTSAGEDSYAVGSSVTITATAQPGYVFLKWTSNGTTISTSPSFTFILTKSRTLVANFRVIKASQFAVILSSNPPSGGSVTGGGAYNPGSQVTITAKANPGHVFLNWTSNGIIISTSAIFKFIINKNRTVVANFN